MGLDLTTLYIVLGGILLVCAPALVITWRLNPDESGPRSWAQGAVLGALSVLVFATYGRDPALHPMDLVGTFSSWACFVFFFRGTREYLRLEPALPAWILVSWAIATPVAIWASVFTPIGEHYRVILGGTMSLLPALGMAHVLLTNPGRNAPRTFLAFAFGSLGSMHVLRVIQTVTSPPMAVYERPLDQIVILISILISASSAVGFSMLCIEGLLLDRARRVEQLDAAVRELGEVFRSFAGGDRSARVGPARAGALEALAVPFDASAVRVSEAFADVERQKNMLAATLESMADGVVLVDREGKVAMINRSACRLFGKGDLLGTPALDLFDPEEAAFASAIIQPQAPLVVRDRLTRLRAQGGSIQVLVHASNVQGGGTPTGVLLVLHDDRELREARAQLLMANRLATMGTVAAGVAHEINNPLAFVITNVEFALEELTGSQPLQRAEVTTALEAARQGSNRVRLIVKDLKTFSRADDEAVQEVDLNAVVERTVAMLSNEIRHHARVELHLAPDLDPVRCNEPQLGQVILNLVHNAAQAIEPGHAGDNEISIRTRAEAGGVTVTVRDTGMGVAPEHRDRIFDAFFTTKPIGMATGLGLTISLQITRELGGRLDFESTVGVGSAFRLWLPVAMRAHARAPSVEEAARGRSSF